jgi:5-methylthioadenosine/S-adenosylhomocysteine deaminase
MKDKKSDEFRDSNLQADSQNVAPRRTFLKSTVGGIAAGTLAASGLANTALAHDWDSDHRKDWNKGRRILLKGGTILSIDPAIGDFLKGDVLIDGTKISKVDKSISSHGATVVDASGTIIVPGFVDSHRHAWQNYFRRAIPNAPLLSDYAAFTHSGIAPFCRPQDHYAGNLITDLGAIYSGVTSMLDYSHNTRSATHADSAIKAHFDSGLRAVFAYGPVSFGTWDQQYPQDIVRVKRKFFSSDNQLVSLRLATNLIEENFALARANGIKITSDAAFARNPPNPNYIPTLLDFGRRGLLGPDVTLIHATAFPDEVFQMIKDTGTRVSLAPTSDAHYRNLGDSITPIQKVLDFGIVAGLSVDVEVTLSGDFFSQIRMAFYVQRMLANKRFIEGDTSTPAGMNPRKILEMATMSGAKCNGLENKIGSLTPGKEADILMIEADDILNMPLNNAVGTVIFGADTSSVRNVFIGGQLMKWDGKLVGVDVEKVRKLVYASRDYLGKQSGLWKPSDILGDGYCQSCTA